MMERSGRYRDAPVRRRRGCSISLRQCRVFGQAVSTNVPIDRKWITNSSFSGLWVPYFSPAGEHLPVAASCSSPSLDHVRRMQKFRPRSRRVRGALLAGFLPMWDLK